MGFCCGVRFIFSTPKPPPFRRNIGPIVGGGFFSGHFQHLSFCGRTATFDLKIHGVLPFHAAIDQIDIQPAGFGIAGDNLGKLRDIRLRLHNPQLRHTVGSRRSHARFDPNIPRISRIQLEHPIRDLGLSVHIHPPHETAIGKLEVIGDLHSRMRHEDLQHCVPKQLTSGSPLFGALVQLVAEPAFLTALLVARQGVVTPQRTDLLDQVIIDDPGSCLAGLTGSKFVS